MIPARFQMPTRSKRICLDVEYLVLLRYLDVPRGNLMIFLWFAVQGPDDLGINLSGESRVYISSQ